MTYRSTDQYVIQPAVSWRLAVLQYVGYISSPLFGWCCCVTQCTPLYMNGCNSNLLFSSIDCKPINLCSFLPSHDLKRIGLSDLTPVTVMHKLVSRCGLNVSPFCTHCCLVDVPQRSISTFSPSLTSSTSMQYHCKGSDERCLCHQDERVTTKKATYHFSWCFLPSISLFPIKT